MQDPKENTLHVVETTSCVHETGCVTLRYAFIGDGRPERSASSTDAIPHLYLKSNRMLDFCLLIWHRECLCSSFAWFEAETEKRTVLEDVSLSEGAETAVGTIHLRWTFCDDMRGSASKSLRTKFCTRWSWVITHPGHFTPWNRAPPLLLLVPLDEVIVGPGSFWQKENLFAIPEKELRLVKTLGGFLEWRMENYCIVSHHNHNDITKIQAVGEIRCGRCRIQALRLRYALCEVSTIYCNYHCSMFCCLKLGQRSWEIMRLRIVCLSRKHGMNFVLRKWETWYSNYAILMVAINGFHKCSASPNTWPCNEVSALSKYLFLSVCSVVTETKTKEKKYPQKQSLCMY